MNRFVCVHGHFYQPPRENPWLEAIELQDSAHPFHDWNARITEECYAANATSRILDDEGRIAEIVNNYSRISFNFGPTLLSWLEEHRPEVYTAILRADKLAQEHFDGHGAAIAQVYNHLIMPLANARDRHTQVAWGVRDFTARFGRAPDGMWLAETAVDTPTLEALADHDIAFTILAPRQAARVRPLSERDLPESWRDVRDGSINPRRPYRHFLPSGRHIDIFFYDGPISRAIAFEDLLERGENLADRLTGAFDEDRSAPQLVHIATDGETYGHHHSFGEMALSYALHYIEHHQLAELTLYSKYLAENPPGWQVEIAEETSWSCVHGIERWRSDCGCHTGGRPEWQQAWRAPLRGALDGLRDTLIEPFEQVAGDLLDDPWAARDAYIDVILARDEDAQRAFLDAHATRPLDDAERVQVWECMELQRHAMLMYTSCGWFFNDLAGIETIQILQYAARVLQLAASALDIDAEQHFLDTLAQARSNTPTHGDGRAIFDAQVRPAMVDLGTVCAHYALASLFEPSAEATETFCYDVESMQRRVYEAGGARMALGRARVISQITRQSEVFEYGALHFGDHNVDGGVRITREDEDLDERLSKAIGAFKRAEFPALIRQLDETFDARVFSLNSLFLDEQRAVIDTITADAVADAEAAARQLHERRAPLMAFLQNLGTPTPEPLAAAASTALHAEIHDLIRRDVPPRAELFSLVDEADSLGIELDWDRLAIDVRRRLDQLVEAWSQNPGSLRELERLGIALELVDRVPSYIPLWRAQNALMRVLRDLPSLLETSIPEQEEEIFLDLLGQASDTLSISPKAWPDLDD